MTFERDGHEVLRVHEVDTPFQRAVVRTHHTMYAHLDLTAPATAAVGETITVTVQLVRWDDRQPITEERDLVVRVDGQEVDRLTTSGGAATIALQFDSPGIYQIEVTGDRVTGASVEVTVA